MKNEYPRSSPPNRIDIVHHHQYATKELLQFTIFPDSDRLRVGSVTD